LRPIRRRTRHPPSSTSSLRQATSATRSAPSSCRRQEAKSPGQRSPASSLPRAADLGRDDGRGRARPALRRSFEYPRRSSDLSLAARQNRIRVIDTRLGAVLRLLRNAASNGHFSRKPMTAAALSPVVTAPQGVSGSLATRCGEAPNPDDPVTLRTADEDKPKTSLRRRHDFFRLSLLNGSPAMRAAQRLRHAPSVGKRRMRPWPL
jgi:hypothetical protein